MTIIAIQCKISKIVTILIIEQLLRNNVITQRVPKSLKRVIFFFLPFRDKCVNVNFKGGQNKV